MPGMIGTIAPEGFEGGDFDPLIHFSISLS